MVLLLVLYCLILLRAVMFSSFRFLHGRTMPLSFSYKVKLNVKMQVFCDRLRTLIIYCILSQFRKLKIFASCLVLYWINTSFLRKTKKILRGLRLSGISCIWKLSLLFSTARSLLQLSYAVVKRATMIF